MVGDGPSIRRSRPEKLERNRNSPTCHSHRLLPHHHCHRPTNARIGRINDFPFADLVTNYRFQFQIW
ncbi:hypothetical protein TNCV_1440221 [Trichonephila clavipes]|nr:hypothetical protein TNCV_1440221 [Trichonephila clavipes]